MLMSHQDYRTCQFWSSFYNFPPFEYYNLFGLCFKFTLPLSRASVAQGIDSRRDNMEVMSSRHGSINMFLIVRISHLTFIDFWSIVSVVSLVLVKKVILYILC